MGKKEAEDHPEELAPPSRAHPRHVLDQAGDAVGAARVAVSPHAGHFFATTWNSVTLRGGGGAASNTCRSFTAITGASESSAPQDPQAGGPEVTVSSGSGDWHKVEDGQPVAPSRVAAKSGTCCWVGAANSAGFSKFVRSWCRWRGSLSVS